MYVQPKSDDGVADAGKPRDYDRPSSDGNDRYVA